jgi:hypothetical protein
MEDNVLMLFPLDRVKVEVCEEPIGLAVTLHVLGAR